MGSHMGDKVGQCTSDSLRVIQVDAFVGSVGIGFGAEDSQGVDGGLWVHLAELSQEWNRATHTIRAWFITIKEFSSNVIEGFLHPWLGVFHTPSLTGMATLDGSFAPVGNVFRNFLKENFLGVMWVSVGW